MPESVRAWQPVRIFGAGLQPHTGRWWDCDPAWDLDALYPRPDLDLPHPDRALAAADPAGDYPQRNAVGHAFRDRHLDRRFTIAYPRTTREAPRPRGRTIGDPDREWQTVLEHRDRYLREAGLTLASPPAAIARCLAQTFHTTSYFRDKPGCPTFATSPRALTHPVEGLLFQCFCVGCAHAYAALADACGLACRTIGCGGHRVAEVLVDGHWHFVENTCRHPGNEHLGAWFPASFQEVTTDPLAFREYMPVAKAASYWGMPNGQFHFMGGTWQSPLTLRFAASNAYALYPQAAHWTVKSADGRRLPLVRRKNGFYWENGVHESDEAAWQELRRRTCPFPVGSPGPISDFLYHPFAPGDCLRQSVWLGDLADLEALELLLPFAPEPDLEFSAVLGGQLVVHCGDYVTSLAAAGAWPPAPPDNRGHGTCTLRIPVGALQANAVNWVILENRSGTTFQAPFIPAAMTPYLAPWSPG